MSQATVALITVTEGAIIFDYINQYRGALTATPGDGKSLPPGIAKKVARGGALPPGIAKRYLPNALQVQLPPRPGYQWIVVDNDVVLFAVATGLIADILADIL
jgi:Nickel/cobalt transporter regulator